MITFLLLLSALIFVTYLYLWHHFNYWKRRGVPNPPVNFLFGNLADAILLKKAVGQIVNDIYSQYEGYAYIGFYKVQKPAILIRDPELIKTVIVKEFASFHDNDFDVDEETDLLMAKNPFSLKGRRWKVVRNQLSPCFTSKKIKSVSPLLQDTCVKMVSYINRQIEVVGKDGFEAKELMSKYTTENVASSAFGLNGNCFSDPKAEFREIGRKILQPSFWLGIKHLIVFILPSLAKIVGAKLFPKDVTIRLRNIVVETLKYRSDNNVCRNDFLSILNELKSKPGEYEFTNDDVVAHAAGFFADGFETSSISLTFIVYEIALNPLIQSKLREEVDRIAEKYEGKLTFDGIQDMTYLDSVFWEGMRKNPPVYTLIRKCTKPFTLPPPLNNGNGSSVLIQPSTPIWISVSGIHADHKYFPKPEKFDPDRFSEENKGNILKGTVLGFGEGPRTCIGQNFGVAQVKFGIATLVRNFEIRVNKKTKFPLELDPRYFMRAALGGIWLDFYKRDILV